MARTTSTTYHDTQACLSRIACARRAASASDRRTARTGWVRGSVLFLQAVLAIGKLVPCAPSFAPKGGSSVPHGGPRESWQEMLSPGAARGVWHGDGLQSAVSAVRREAGRQAGPARRAHRAP